MKLLKLVFLLCCFLGTLHTVDAQNARLNRAEKRIKKGDYQGAIELYLKVLNKKNDSEAVMGIAECYRAIKDYNEMVYWYQMVVRLPQAQPEAHLYLGEAFKATGQYDQAQASFEKYLELNPSSTQARMLLKSSNEEVIKDLKASGALYQVALLDEERGKKINMCENVDDFAPAYYKDGIAFVSDRSNKGLRMLIDARTGRSFTDLYFANAELKDPETYEYEYTEAERLQNGALKYKYHNGPAFFTKDASMVFFSRSNMDGKADDGYVHTKIYMANNLGGDRWSTPVSLPFNSDEYNTMHPALSADGLKLYFASDMPGGFGGMDLYVSYLEEGRWSPPINLGPNINTEGNEVFPFVHHDRSLYFASDGHIGLGALDIYMTTDPFELGDWTQPENLGYPVNSKLNDFSFIVNDKKTHGYFASDRGGEECGDDIYSFRKFSVEAEILVYDARTKMPLENATVMSPCSPVEEFRTNEKGRVIIEVPMNKSCDFSADLPPYKPNSKRIATNEYTPGDKITVEIPLQLEREFALTGKIFSEEIVPGEDVPLKDVRISILYADSLAIETARQTGEPLQADSIVAYTDENGEYYIDSLPENVIVSVTASKMGFSEGYAEFSTYNVDPSESLLDSTLYLYCLTNDCAEYVDLPDSLSQLIPGRKNLVHIFYDFNKANIRSDAEPALDALADLLNEYPSARVEITSHTDARGSENYNMNLSRRRARSVVRYLREKGISRRRLRYKGMGEKVMLNDCYDGVNCTEEQHQENRRTEFMVFDIDGATLESKKPTYIKVDPCTSCGQNAAPMEGNSEAAPVEEDDLMNLPD